ncbi:hypothetical protein NicSoilC5_21260 [Arthrobacter sp. NicSoilC5]|nr:hypothetical protein NicSoilC5_21260 [Arthrobacter sp. NicSoilC5]
MITPPLTTTPPQASRELAVNAANGFLIQSRLMGAGEEMVMGCPCLSGVRCSYIQLSEALSADPGSRAVGRRGCDQSRETAWPASMPLFVTAETDGPVKSAKHRFHIAKLNFQKTMARPTKRC